MMGLKENKPLVTCLMITGSIVLALAAGLFPDLCVYLEIVEFPDEVQVINNCLCPKLLIEKCKQIIINFYFLIVSFRKNSS